MGIAHPTDEDFKIILNNCLQLVGISEKNTNFFNLASEFTVSYRLINISLSFNQSA